MITLTFEPTNPEQAALLGQFLPQYMRAGELVVSGEAEQVKAVVETAAQAEEKAPKRAKAGKPAATPAAAETAQAEAAASEPAAESRSDKELAVREEPPVTLEEVRAKLAAISQAGKKAEAKALLDQFGVAKLTDLPADKYAELLARAEEI